MKFKDILLSIEPGQGFNFDNIKKIAEAISENDLMCLNSLITNFDFYATTEIYYYDLTIQARIKERCWLRLGLDLGVAKVYYDLALLYKKDILKDILFKENGYDFNAIFEKFLDFIEE